MEQIQRFQSGVSIRSFVFQTILFGSFDPNSRLLTISFESFDPKSRLSNDPVKEFRPEVSSFKWFRSRASTRSLVFQTILFGDTARSIVFYLILIPLRVWLKMSCCVKFRTKTESLVFALFLILINVQKGATVDTRFCLDIVLNFIGP